jgi:hypothetical protein
MNRYIGCLVALSLALTLTNLFKVQPLQNEYANKWDGKLKDYSVSTQGTSSFVEGAASISIAVNNETAGTLKKTQPKTSTLVVYSGPTSLNRTLGKNEL